MKRLWNARGLHLFVRRLFALVGLIVAGHVSAQTGSPLMKRDEFPWPSGDRASSAVLVERLTPVDVRRGSEFSYEIRLTNLTKRAMDGLTLTERLPAGFTLRGTQPEPTRRDRDLCHWTLRQLAPNVAYTIRLTGSTDQPQDLSWCATLSSDAAVCSSTKIVEPRLTLTKSMPAEVLICEEIPIRMTVTNTGTGTARNVQVTDTLPAGMILPDGKNGMLFTVGDLAGGQSRDLAATARATRPGQYRNPATAREEGGGPGIDASAVTIVREPKLVVTKSGPNRRFVGRTATFDITVQNTGDGPARDTLLVDNVPAGVEIVSATGGGRISGSQISWNLGTLPPGVGKTVQVTLKPNQIGRLTNTASVRALCTESSASATLDVQGIPAILLEVVDVEDPIEVGGNVTYEIVVTNQGSSAGTNIALECTLPGEQQFVSATGATQGTAQNNVVRFAPLASLAPQMRAKFVLTAKGLKSGDVRFKVSMTSDQTDSPVEETEATRFYE